jgi:hypothetical protein
VLAMITMNLSCLHALACRFTEDRQKMFEVGGGISSAS